MEHPGLPGRIGKDEDEEEAMPKTRPLPGHVPAVEQQEVFDPETRTGAWFAEGEGAEQELASVTPSRLLPEVYLRALEEDAGSSSRLRHVPWAIGAGIAGIAIVLAVLL
jgi:hypothetical protein